jgi:hypothetical protein
MTAPQIGVFQDQGGAVFNAAAYGAVGDALPLTIVSATAGSSTITVSGDALPSAADVGKYILVPTAFVPKKKGFAETLVTTITAVSGTTVTLAEAPGASVAGVPGLYGSDATKAIHLALEAAASAGGGTVFIPTGTYLLTASLSLASQVNVRGAGPGTRLVSAGASPVLSLMSVAGCAVMDLGIDLFNTRNFNTAVSAGCAHDSPGVWSQDIRLERCSLYNSLLDWCQGGETPCGVLLAGCQRVWITGCFTYGVELKCALAPGVSAVQVTGNTIVNPLQYGVSLAINTPGVIVDCIIANNVFQNVSQQGAIYVGDDNSTTAHVVCERVSIVGNVISGVPSPLGFFILLRIPPLARDWIVKDNVIRVQTHTPRHHAIPNGAGGGAPAKKALTCGVSGIYVAPRGAPTAVIDNLVIAGNIIAGTDQPGIYLDTFRADHGPAKNDSCIPGPPATKSPPQPQVGGFLIQGNVLEDTGGIAVLSQYSPQNAYWDGRIAGNVLRGGSIALLNGGPVDICDNLIDTRTTPVAVATAATFDDPEIVTGAAIILGAAAAGSSVSSMVYNNRIRNAAHGVGLVNGIREAGDVDGIFDVVYSGNVITGNTGIPILTMGAGGPPAAPAAPAAPTAAEDALAAGARIAAGAGAPVVAS